MGAACQALGGESNAVDRQGGGGQTERLLEYARRATVLDPLWEPGQRDLVRALALDGQRQAALEAYMDYQVRLAVELGVPPEHETRALYERLRRESDQEAELQDLPAPLTPFVGRQGELAELSALLLDPTCRLVTLFGPGGVGKTRLALEAAHLLAPDFPDGVYFISLSAYQPGSLLWVHLVEALRFPLRPQQDPERQMLDYLGDKQVLLVFDSFEVALEQASWLADLMRDAPHLTALVTSRSRLEISAEQVFSLGGMAAPAQDELEIADQFEAVQLFQTFARHRQPDFRLDEHTRPGVARLCRLLQGLPLGLLLASAWVELYSPQEIADQIERSLDFLEVRWKDVPARHTSLRATFDYSWNQLTDNDQWLLTTLAVFRGGFSLQATREIAQAPARLLQSLVDKSMVNRTSDNRYQMHDLLHQFASQRLEETPERFREVRSRHSRFYLSILADWGKDLKGPRQRQALETIDQDVENLRAAWRWAITNQDWDSISAGLEGMSWYADLRFRFEEGERACRTAREAIPPISYSYLVTELTAWQAHFLRRLG